MLSCVSLTHGGADRAGTNRRINKGGNGLRLRPKIEFVKAGPEVLALASTRTPGLYAIRVCSLRSNVSPFIAGRISYTGTRSKATEMNDTNSLANCRLAFIGCGVM